MNLLDIIISYLSLSSGWRTLSNEKSIKEVYVLGNINSNMIDEYIFNNIKFNSIPIIDIPIYLRDLKAKRLNKNYGLDTKLVNYVEIYSIPKLTYFEENYVMIVFNAIWGSASLESRLYKALRTKRGLCYNVNTYYQKYDKCLILHSKVESKKIKEVSKIIKSTLRELIKNGVTSKEVTSAKRIILNTISLIKDSPTKLIDNLMFQNMNILDNIDERRKQFNKITSDDVIKLAKKLKLIITYSQGDLK